MAPGALRSVPVAMLSALSVLFVFALVCVCLAYKPVAKPQEDVDGHVVMQLVTPELATVAPSSPASRFLAPLPIEPTFLTPPRPLRRHVASRPSAAPIRSNQGVLTLDDL